jgi:hypothetical protein
VRGIGFEIDPDYAARAAERLRDALSVKSEII